MIKWTWTFWANIIIIKLALINYFQSKFIAGIQIVATKLIQSDPNLIKKFEIQLMYQKWIEIHQKWIKIFQKLWNPLKKTKSIDKVDWFHLFQLFHQHFNQNQLYFNCKWMKINPKWIKVQLIYSKMNYKSIKIDIHL